MGKKKKRQKPTSCFKETYTHVQTLEKAVEFCIIF